MASKNLVILIGNVGQDPEVKFTQAGLQVINFSLATSENFKKKDGSKTEKTQWHRVVGFGKMAELASEFLRKGVRVYIEGKIDYNTYEQDGVKKYSTQIIAEKFLVLSGKRDDASSGDDNAPPVDAGTVDHQDLPW